ncbi:TonB-dependent siderophore receptor [Sinimarinibacterium flocculans]|uniref:Iron complex outermembrane receptor protein n=1 Tax=Sinimarinibacterium flocculans TaxID=985250 RepID=A0A318ECL4_9GAMM|nr:TonB-dependent siderophore receptor [Sinimarinibacterium flocculans]PXV67742.1 iron complex outermembrane receptor protein [Sinimarinibacterium flocculans]
MRFLTIVALAGASAWPTAGRATDDASPADGDTGLYDTVPVVRERPDDEVPVQLAPLEITGHADALPRYLADRASSATKADTPLVETPQSISVISAERLLDLGALTLQDALRYTAGVRSDAYGFDSRGDFANIRGTAYVPYRDGLRAQFGYYNNVRPDVYALQSVEVLRGPSSVLYGQGTSGGMVNVTSKRPQPAFAHELRAEFGEYARRQLALDTTGPLTGDGSLLYRLVALMRESDTQVDFVGSDRWFVAPSLSWHPTPWLSWTVLGNFQRDESGSSTAFLPWEGTVLPSRNGRIPTGRFVSEPDYDRYDTQQDAVTSLLRIDLGERWSLHQNLRYVDSGAVYRSLYPNVYVGDPYQLDPIQRRRVLRVTNASDTDARALTADHRLQGQWRWGPVEQTVLVGVDATDVRLREVAGTLSIPQIIQQGRFDLYEPVYGNYIVPDTARVPDLELRQTGVYIQDQIRFGDRLILLLGARYDDASSESVGNTPPVENSETSLRAGLLYRFDAGWAPYVSYSESFEPVADFDADGNPFKPVRGEQIEAGVKFESADGGALFTLAAFDIEETNRLAPGDTPAEQKQLGIAEIRGFEFEAMTRWFDALDLLLSYTYLDGHSDEGPNADEATRIQNIAALPRHSATAWLRWRFALFGLPGFSIGGGARYTATLPSEGGTVEVPAVTLFDAMAAWESEHWRIAVNGTNLEDESVLSICLERGDCFYGSRRNVVGSVAYRF